jgi:hypothetical protein
VIGVLLVVWNLAKIMTIPGFAGFTCGVSVIFSSFLSYAVYEVSLGAAGCDGGDCVCGSANAEPALGVVIGVDWGICEAGDAAVELPPGPNNPRISSIVVFC